VKAIFPKLSYEQCKNYTQFNFFTGLRASKMIALRCCHINFLKKKANVCEVVLRFTRQDTKTGKPLIVNLPGPAVDALLSQKSHTF
jgi:integrase